MDYSSFTNIEVLAKVVGIRAAKRLYSGAVTPLFEPPTDVSREHLQLAAAAELVRRWLHEDLRKGSIFESPVSVRDYLRLAFAKEEREIFVGLFLDAQHRLIEAEALFFGTLTQTSVYPREVVKRALYLNAAAAVFAHNHPSGVAEPSRADEFLTATLRTALALVDIRLLDHFVVGGADVTSFAERGLL
jgi:DNA repair protein RadC